MSYIGSTPTTQSFIAGTDYFNGTGSAVNFTLSRSVNSVNDIEVIVNNVEQIPSGYSVSGTTLTFSAAPSAGTSNVYVRYLSTTNLSLAIPAGTSAAFNTVTATSLTATTLAATNSSYTGTLTGAAATFSGIVAANGGGIQFPATQVASADANTLDDYEEGTWTPVDSSGAGLSLSNTSGNCFYTKVGRTVTVSFRLTYPSTASGSVAVIGGLPFLSANTTVNNQSLCFAEQNFSAGAMGVLNYNAASFLFLTTNGSSVTVHTNAGVSTKDFRGSATYQAAS
jgi:hypothetical protein